MKLHTTIVSLYLVCVTLFLGYIIYDIKNEYLNIRQDVNEINEKISHPIPVKTNKIVAHREQDKYCLAKNIYHEARGEPYLGRLAVAQVTLNRYKTGYWGDSICSVVMSPSQFSWTLDRTLRYMKPSGIHWQESLRLAEDVLVKGVRLNGFENVLHFHADYVRPVWRKEFTQIAQIGTHVFYRTN